MVFMHPFYRLFPLDAAILVPPMKRLFISDAHLTGLQDPNQALLVDLLMKTNADEVYFLGDVFHFWWGQPGFRDPEFEPFLSAIESLRERLVPCFWVRGNHDFHLGPVLEEDLGVVVADRFRLTIAGAEVLLVHGDEADRSFGYRLTKAVLRGRLFAWLMNRLSPGGIKTLGRRMAGTSRDHMGSNAGLILAQKEWAEKQHQDGVDVVVLGHSHAPGISQLASGILVNLGDFVQAHTYLEIDSELRLCHWRLGHGDTIEKQSIL
jgi:UDP-2,3-diacylglucosamine hydrolase